MRSFYREPQAGPAEHFGVKLFGILVLAAMTATGLRTVHFGAPPPDFQVAARPAPVMLSQLHGKPVVINFWASWCPPCTDELPYFQRLQNEMGSRVRLVMIDWDETPDVAQGYLRGHGYRFPVVSDADGKIYAAYSLDKIPDTIVLNASGDVTYVSLGGLSWDELSDAVDPLVSL